MKERRETRKRYRRSDSSSPLSIEVYHISSYFRNNLLARSLLDKSLLLSLYSSLSSSRFPSLCLLKMAPHPGSRQRRGADTGDVELHGFLTPEGGGWGGRRRGMGGAGSGERTEGLGAAEEEEERSGGGEKKMPGTTPPSSTFSPRFYRRHATIETIMKQTVMAAPNVDWGRSRIPSYVLLRSLVMVRTLISALVMLTLTLYISLPGIESFLCTLVSLNHLSSL